MTKEAIVRALGLLPVPLGLYRRILRPGTFGLAYHMVSDEPKPHVRHIFPYKSARRFTADLRWLKRRCRPLSYDELLARGSVAAAGEPRVFVAFDDGFAECWSVARPLLRRYDVPCIFFVTTRVLDNRAVLPRNKVSLCIEAIRRMEPGAAARLAPRLRHAAGAPAAAGERALVRWLHTLTARDEPRVDRIAALLGIDFDAYLREQRPYLTRRQVRRLAAEGFTIGAHTVTHTHLRRLPDAAAVECEIVESCAHVRELTGIEPVPFAFPFDSAGVDRELLASIRARNPFVGPMFDTRGLRADRPFIVPRVWADPPAARGDADATNLPALMRTAHVTQAFHRMSRGIGTAHGAAG